MPKKFTQKVYNQLKRVPPGKVTTYKDLAVSLNSKAYRAVGVAMKNNPYAPSVPCHRVVKSDGILGGFSGKGGVRGKALFLKSEGIQIKDGKIVEFKKRRHRF
ncbi:MGMT family protein [Candidatus Woesearchaeota archaeon]|nr:MGMT family protein [Candidatus Woesearchaeota archaeon]